MKLYYKNYNEYPVDIPELSILLRDDDIYHLKSNYPNYPIPYCLEIDGITRICLNEDGYFDFSKSIVDIGADLGEYCWLTHFAHSYACEPNKVRAAMLRVNALMHDKLDSLDVFECLLSSEEKEIPFNGFNSVVYDENTPRLMSKTLDSFNLKNIGLIKIDVEMHEYEVLLGAEHTIISNDYPPIVFECFDVGVFGMQQELYDNIFNFLKEHGYTVHKYWVNKYTHLAIHQKQ